jgi:hypothetical protein
MRARDGNTRAGRLGRRAALLLLILFIVVAAVFAMDYARASLFPAPIPAVNLRAWDQGGQLRIEWDRTSPLTQRASSASLEIKDSGRKTGMRLERDMLSRGGVTYVRSSGDVQVHMQLEVPGGVGVSEWTRFIGNAGTAAPDSPQADRVGAEPQVGKVAELEAEVKKLRSALSAETERRKLSEDANRILRQRLP